MGPRRGPTGKRFGRRASRPRVSPGGIGVALLIVLTLLLPLAAPARAQGDEPPIVPIGDGTDAAVDREPIDPALPDPALPIGEEDELPGILPAESAPPPSGASGTASLADWAPPETVYVPETGHSVDGVFLDLWRGWGGANGFGYPITPEMEEDGRIVQYYGYARLEYWPEDSSGNVVRFGDLGEEMRPLLLRRGLPGDGGPAAEIAAAVRAWMPLSAEPVAPDDAAYRFFPETGHGVGGELLAFWEATGAETFLGSPLSEAYEVDDVTFQVFQRGKVAQEAGGSPYLLPAGELVAARRGLDTAPVAQGDLPVYSEELFVPPAPTPSARPSAPELDPNAERWIEVSIGGQYMTAYQGDVAVWEGLISTGKEGFDTPLGSYNVLSKLESQTMAGVIGGESYNVPDVPSVMYFTDRGHAIHGTYWHNNFGAPMSHGCVNLPMDAAAWLYGWAGLGTRVEVVP